jgi:hypothetical protein
MCLLKNYIVIVESMSEALFSVYTTTGCCGYCANLHPVVKRGTSVTNATTPEAKYLPKRQ